MSTPRATLLLAYVVAMGHAFAWYLSWRRKP